VAVQWEAVIRSPPSGARGVPELTSAMPRLLDEFGGCLRPPAGAPQAAWTECRPGVVMVLEACRFWATPMDVAEWLRGLGLEQYTPAFRDNDIDGEVLRRLTGEDLRELGVRSIGHRRRLLDAISALSTALAGAAVTLASTEMLV